MSTKGGTTKATPLPAPVETVVECRTNPRERSKARHPITIHPDWSVDTPHDLAAERVAVAFGGYCSCLDLVEKTIPALSQLQFWQTRAERPALRRNKSDKWLLPAKLTQEQCCESITFPSPQSAFKHLLSSAHTSRASDAPRWQLTALTKALGTTSWSRAPKADPQVTQLIWDPAGIRELWQAGIHPSAVPGLAEVASQVSAPLPVSYYENLAYSKTPIVWFRQVLGQVTDASIATWLVSLYRPEKMATAEEWQAWLGYGIPRHEVGIGIRHQVTAAVVQEVAGLVGWTPRAAARRLTAWLEANCHPTTDDFQLMIKYDATGERPALGVINSLEDQTRSAEKAPTRTELAVMMSILGSQQAVLRAVQNGVTDLSVLDARLSAHRNQEN
ncbi:MAG TPA: hypothetical protein PLO27_04315 [Marmoricola sp.]|nr:hypothetical protein [Marmoricola sp.]HNO38849.1 hypothetical protein [Marmoricola sp.]